MPMPPPATVHDAPSLLHRGWANLRRRLSEGGDVPLGERLYAPYRKLRDRHLTTAGKILVFGGLGIGLFSLDVEGRQTYVFWSLLFGLGLASWIYTTVRRLARPLTVALERRIPDSVTAGSLVRYDVFVTNLGSRPLFGLCIREEAMPWGVRPDMAESFGAFLPRLDPGKRERVQLAARFARRGLYQLRGIRAERVCPLGITRAGITVDSPSRVAVYPRSFPVDEVDFTEASVYQAGGVPCAASVGESLEFVGLRDYRPGDPIRHISWKAWARTGEPVVTEHMGEYYRRVAILLDTRVRPGRQEGEAFEAAVSTTASITAYFDEHEYVIDLFAAGETVYHLQTGMGLGHAKNVLDLLSCVGSTIDPAFPSVDEALRRLLNRLSGLVIVTTNWWPESRDFYRSLVTEVPEIKVLLVRSGPPSTEPEGDVADPRLLRSIDPGRLSEEVLRL